MILELDAQRGNLTSHLYQSIWCRASVSRTPCAYIFVQRTDACPILVRMPRETCGDVNISVIDTFRPTVASCSARSENRASRFRISVYGHSASVCVPAVTRVCAFASCGFVVCPEGRTTSCLRESRFICVPSPLAYPAWPHHHHHHHHPSPSPSPSPQAPRIDRQRACKHRCTPRM